MQLSIGHHVQQTRMRTNQPTVFEAHPSRSTGSTSTESLCFASLLKRSSQSERCTFTAIAGRELVREVKQKRCSKTVLTERKVLFHIMWDDHGPRDFQSILSDDTTWFHEISLVCSIIRKNAPYLSGATDLDHVAVRTAFRVFANDIALSLLALIIVMKHAAIIKALFAW